MGQAITIANQISFSHAPVKGKFNLFYILVILTSFLLNTAILVMTTFYLSTTLLRLTKISIKGLTQHSVCFKLQCLYAFNLQSYILNQFKHLEIILSVWGSALHGRLCTSIFLSHVVLRQTTEYNCSCAGCILQADSRN